MYSNGDGGQNSNASGKPPVDSQPRTVVDRPLMPRQSV